MLQNNSFLKNYKPDSHRTKDCMTLLGQALQQQLYVRLFDSKSLVSEISKTFWLNVKIGVKTKERNKKYKYYSL